MRILSVVGARPNLMKIAPLLRAMRPHREIQSILVHTGQHYDARMSDAFFTDLDIPRPDHGLGVGSGPHGAQTAQIMMALEPLLEDIRPDVVVVVGDVNSTLAAALVAAKLQIPVAHVEAGLRSFDRSMPEEINRILTDAVAELLFTTEASANENLLREGVGPERIFFVGNVMIDTLLGQLARARSLRAAEKWGLAAGEYALLTLHRPANVDSPEVLARIVDTIVEVQTRLPVLFPVHPRTRARLEGTEAGRSAERTGRLRLLDPVGYLEFLGLMADARLVLTDSGGIQEETTVLGVPCLTLRDNTERPVTISRGTNQLVGTDPGRIAAAVARVLEDPPHRNGAPELWDGHAAERIVDILRRRFAST